jgi:hypothetical protein
MLQFTGVWLALATFLGIWWGHVGVRWLEARSPSIWPPLGLLATAGIALNIFSLFAPNVATSGVLSIVGITLIWDAFEMYRQQNRVRKGHAPANPDNPRHAAILANGQGITEDLLDREPQGFPVASTATAKSSGPAPNPNAVPALKQREYGYGEVEA